MFGHFAVFLVGFGELTALGGRGDGPEVKNQCWMEVSQLFLSETVVIVLGTYRTERHALTSCANPCSKQA